MVPFEASNGLLLSGSFSTGSTLEDGRLEGIEIQLHGLGWGKRYTPPGDLPDGPTIDLWPTHGTHHHPIDPDYPVEWCAHLPGDPVHGATDTIAEALDQAVASIERRLGTQPAD